MIKLCSKKLLFVLFIVVTTPLFATIGVKDFMPTASGEYVYYRDYTFHSETYIGFIMYDENTYGMRYYAINPKSGSQEVKLLISLDPDKEVPEMTGEKIITATTQEDIEAINYLHELLYEFSARRKKENGKISSKPRVVKDSFQQFGGDMLVTYDAAIPIFNLHSIKNTSGKILFEVQSIGRLSDSNDNSFFDFKISEELLKNTTTKKAKTLSVSNQTKIVFDSISITIDEGWEQKLENLWGLNDDALFAVSRTTIPSGNFDKLDYSELDFFTRRLLLSAKENPLLLSQTIIERSKNKIYTNSPVYSAESKSLNRQLQVVLRSSSNKEDYYILTLIVHESVYKANKAYFDGIINSIK